MIRGAFFVCLAAMTVACDDGPTRVFHGPGAIDVTIVTTGADLDPNGYRLTVDSGFTGAVSVNQVVRIDEMEPGSHVLWLEDLASNCQIAGPNPRLVTVRPRGLATVTFAVTCVQYTGTIRVTTATTGAELDPNGYSVIVDEGASSGSGQPIGLNGSVTFERIPQGEHSIRLDGIARNCIVEPPNPRPAAVVPGATTEVAFVIRCSETGSLRVITTTSGTDVDPNGYSLSIKSQQVDTTAVLSGNGTVTVTMLPPGDFDLTLQGVSTNCDVVGTARRSVTITGAGTAEIGFDVVCAAAGLLAFVSHRDGNQEIYAIKSNGADPRRLTTNSATDGSPAWSPDGSRIAFNSNRDGDTEIYVMNADGSNPVRLTIASGEDYSPSWSPDGARIAFTSQRDGNAEIYVMNADGTNPVRLTSDDGIDSEPAWSPDGQRIAFMSNRDGDNDIYVMSAVGSGVTALTSNTDDDWSPAWSPDGARIAFSRGVDCYYYYYCQYELFVMTASGTDVTQLTSTSCDEYDPAWSPDGRRIAFTSLQSYSGYDPCPTSVMVMRSDGTDVTLVTNGGAFAPTWRP